ncbi:Glucose-6-phosphate 1-dehydrogenase [Arsenophonus endosymbiont of Bemisia tabaci Q2]|nr:Glucose-6-phosphate 1-dehydrogenase [Arsenophonus endosymbiont of Bemisia tabaci Q2]
MAINKAVQACNLIIFGEKGDLARRKLLPLPFMNWKKRAISS